MTGYTQDVERFNLWFGINYCTLQKYCKRYRIEEDLLQDTYLNIHNRIVRSGYTESYFMTYVKRALRNLKINEGKKLNNKHFIEVNNTDFTNTIEETLQTQDENEKDTQLYREEIIFFSRMMFMYLNQRQYNEEWQFVFRCYYLMPNRFTYNKLTCMTGINKNKCTKIIQTMKQDIRENFLIWLKDDRNRSNTINE